MIDINNIREKLGRNEKNGSIMIKILRNNLGNLMDISLESVNLFNIQVRGSIFTLNRDINFNLVFTHYNPKTGIREAIVNLKELNLNIGLFIVLTWSEEKNFLKAGGIGGSDLKSIKAEQKPGKIRMGKNGTFYRIGDKGIEIGLFRVREANQNVLMSNAKEMWDFNVKKVSILIEGCNSKNHLFNTILLQQCLVILVTGFEIYTRSRFIEIEKECKIPNIEALMNEFVKKDYLKENVQNYAKSKEKSLLESILKVKRGIGLINFQNWHDCKKAYNIAYGIKFGEIQEIKNKILMNIQNYIKLRHKIIHSIKPITVINFDRIPQEKPIFLNKKYIEQTKEDFVQFIDKLHKLTESL